MSDAADDRVPPPSIINASPTVYDCDDDDAPPLSNEECDALRTDIYSVIRHIADPEHPHTLEQLRVVSLSGIHVAEVDRSVVITLIPTVPHCSLTLIIGLCIRVAVEAEHRNIKLNFAIPANKHQTAAETSRQLNDKERCAAAMEIDSLAETVKRLISKRHGND